MKTFKQFVNEEKSGKTSQVVSKVADMVRKAKGNMNPDKNKEMIKDEAEKEGVKLSDDQLNKIYSQVMDKAREH